MCAIRSKSIDCIRALRNAGAHLTWKSVDLGIEMCLASSSEDLKTLSAWVAAGVDPNQADYDGRTALHIAVENGSKEIVEYLLKNGANPEAADKFGNTPMSRAIAQDDAEVMQMLRTLHGPSPLPSILFAFNDSQRSSPSL
ncbi:unnamed protein product [Anisakis simplex]|uniref:ANK_REP_REGION domain-containing protein n=1 Tax=Anisakis simplex TaxID=6269 RepID=A0A0M3J1S2_ANISI|nr:unnamed protein product [Anisakis simplex]